VSRVRQPRLLPLGDSSLLVQFGDEIDLAANQRVHALDARLNANRLSGVVETVPAYASLVVLYDPLALTLSQVSNWVKEESGRVETAASRPGRLIKVPVHYGGEYGPDLPFVAAQHGLNIREVVHIHAGREYFVFMMGFTPGFPYLGKLDEAIATPRLETPRTRVPAGTVAIAGSQTGIYPIDSPGGWRLIGRTSLQLFDPASDAPFLFSPGDAVRFEIEALDA
jgi:KipI family sensor histidine kinase inhibitor